MQDQEHLFLVGSEDGRLYKCSKTYNSQFLATYEGHAGAVYAVHWNAYHPESFLSASADWTVKLWHSNRSQVRSIESHTSFLASKGKGVRAQGVNVWQNAGCDDAGSGLPRGRCCLGSLLGHCSGSSW